MNTVAAMQWTTDLLALATGVSGAFCLLALVASQVGARERWLRLAVMGGLETGYCALMIPFFRSESEEASLFWIQLISVFMPFMTWLFVELTIDIAQLREHWMRRFSGLTLLLTAAFSLLLVVDMSAGTRLIFESVSIDRDTLHMSLVQATPMAKVYLGFVNVAFYVSAYFLFRHWRLEDRSLAPLIVGCFLYFLSITNDFNILFGLYDAPFLQHFGFLALYIGFTLFHGLEQVRVARQLREADAEVKKHRGQMIESEKLRALGMASSFVAHEMNNVLTLLSVASTLEARRASQGTEPRGFSDTELSDTELGDTELSDTELAVQQLTSLVRSLASFSRDASGDEPELTEVQRLVSEATRIARARAKTLGVELTTDVADGLYISCRPARVVQALLNLLNNGCDAAVENIAAEGAAWVRVEARRRGDDVTIAVIDSGPGIPAEVRDHILEPFFTTKAAGAGTGLGLAVVLDIAASEGGDLTLDGAGEHTRFVVAIPAAGKLSRTA